MADAAAHYFLVVVTILLMRDTTACREACSAVGLDGSNTIPDSSFTASSVFSNDYKPHEARFSSNRCWKPNDSANADDYLQIDLGKVFVVCAVATRGNPYFISGEWTTEYNISTSSDGNLWIPYSETNNVPKLFPGNTDHVTAVKNDLVIPVLAKLIRFAPTQYYGYKALRVEVYGFDGKDFSCSSLPVGVASVAKIPDNSMTSSSQYNTSTPASNGRLGHTAGSSWCAATSESSPYLQVKLGSPYIICGVATQSDHTSDNWVQTYQIQTSKDGSLFTDYKHNNANQDFVGNNDRNTVVKNPLYEGTVSEYVRIKPKSNHGTTSCMRTELYGVQHTACSKMSIGVSYASLVPDHRFTASSYFTKSAYPNKYLPNNARLRTINAWEPEKEDPRAWLQIDLGFVVYVCAVATQGNGYPPKEYVMKYKLTISLDNVNWKNYTENNDHKIFTGNTDKITIVTNTLATPTKTKFLRFYPTEFRDYAAMRVDVYGVPSTPSKPANVKISTVNPDDKAGPKVKVKWDIPSSPNGNIRGYWVSYGPLTGGENKTVLNNNTGAYIFDACGGVTYKVKVWAFTVADGDKEERTIVVSTYVPTKVIVKETLKYNATTYNVTFQPLPDTNGRITIYELSIERTKYGSTQNIKLVKVSCGPQVKCHSSASQDCSHVLYDLPQCTTYSIRVRAYTSSGPGPFSDESTFVTAAPGSPRNLTVLKISKTTAMLKWSKPQPLTKPVEKYIVIYHWNNKYSFNWPDNITNAVKEYHKPPASQDVTLTLTGLYPATRYSFSVSAETECGIGNKSDEVTGATDTGDTLPQEKKKCSTYENILIGLVAIAVIQLAFIVLLLVYIRYLRYKVKELLTKRNYEEQSPQEEIIYENSTVCNRQPEVDIQMSDVTTTVVPEYDFVDTSPKFPPNGNGLKSLNKSSHIGKQSLPSHGDNNISTRPVSNANKRGTPAHQNEPPTSQGNRSAFGKAIEKFDMNKPSEHTAPSAARQVDQLKTARKPSIPPKPMVKPSPYQIVQLNSNVSNNVSVKSPKKVNNNASSGPIPSKRRPDIPVLLPSCSSHHKPLSCNVTNNILTGREPSGDYQQLDPSKLIQDSSYEKLNKGTMSKNR